MAFSCCCCWWNQTHDNDERLELGDCCCLAACSGGFGGNQKHQGSQLSQEKLGESPGEPEETWGAPEGVCTEGRLRSGHCFAYAPFRCVPSPPLPLVTKSQMALYGSVSVSM